MGSPGGMPPNPNNDGAKPTSTAVDATAASIRCAAHLLDTSAYVQYEVSYSHCSMPLLTSPRDGGRPPRAAAASTVGSASSDSDGGENSSADRRRPYVTQPDGRREAVVRRFLLADNLPHPRPGAQIFVPPRVISEQPSNAPQILGVVASVIASLTTIVIVATQ